MKNNSSLYSLNSISSNSLIVNDASDTLQSSWNLYFHDPFNNNWDKKSFYNICSINTINDFWDTFNSLKKFMCNGMFFIMRNNIIPLWEENDNKEGGYISYKIQNSSFIEEIEKILIMLLSEKTLKSQYVNDYNLINGMSISPKKNFSIVRIWLRNMKYNDLTYYNVDSNTTFIKKHIHNDS